MSHSVSSLSSSLSVDRHRDHHHSAGHLDYHRYTPPHRSPRSSSDRLLIKLTTGLMSTYNAINDKYYAQKRKKQAELLQRGPASSSSSSSSSSAAAPVPSNRGGMYNEGFDDKDYNYIIQPKEKLGNGRYIVEHSIGKGSFGRVVKAWDTAEKEWVALKIVKSKSAFYKQAQVEIKILSSLSGESDKWNIVSLRDHFMHQGHQCLVFELLSLNLYELLKNTRFQGVSLKLIAKFAYQLLQTLYFLGAKDRRDKRIIHCDLKPENILLRNSKKSAIKVIDFGSACFASQKTYTYIQSRFYRAPEILLNLPYSCSIDMWSLGCILIELHTGRPLFDGSDEADQMMKQVELLGIPPAFMLERNRKAEKFFEKDPTIIPPVPSLSALPSTINGASMGWRVKSKYRLRRGISLRSCLGDKYHDSTIYQLFEDFVTKMLQFDPKARIKPAAALQHPFLQYVAQHCHQPSATLNTMNLPMPSDMNEQNMASSGSSPMATSAVASDLPSPNGGPVSSPPSHYRPSHPISLLSPNIGPTSLSLNGQSSSPPSIRPLTQGAPYFTG